MERIHFHEVVMRDGLQSEPQFVPTDAKVALVDALSECGFAKIEVTSFTSPRAIPMLRDAEEVMGRIRRQAGVAYAALVPNARGAERALESGADELNLVMSVSTTHNLANLRMTPQRSFEALAPITALAGSRATINLSLACAFGCPMEGAVAQEAVLDWARRFRDQGVQGLTLCDTTGMAHPGQVSAMAEAAQRLDFGQLTMHFHDTRGMGLANVLAAVRAGIRRFDGSLGALGGCPYAPGASGNICSEDAVHMLAAMGYDTGVDLQRLLAVGRALPAVVGHAVPGQVCKAGPSMQLHPVPPDVLALMRSVGLQGTDSPAARQRLSDPPRQAPGS